jgi:tryptophan synthase beta chain
MQTKFLLDENEIPKSWYNILPDLPKPLAPPLGPDGKPIGPEALAPIFPMELIKQEMSMEHTIKIPEEIRDIYRIWRPSPLIRAHRLEKFLGTPAKIFYKYEGVSPPGSHKPNTSVAQAYYNMKEGIERISTETGAGQWGSSLGFACNFFDIECKVYMVRCSFDQKPYRKFMMKVWGADCVASPSKETNTGRAILEKDPDCPGSLGIAISEAVEDAATHDNTHYALGSVLNHVMLHQTIIGQEAKKQLAMAEIEKPDIVIGCAGGGSNFAGLALPYVRDKIKDNADIEIIGVEPASCPTMTKGPFAYDHGDTAKMTPLLKMYTLGHVFIPPGIHAGGLRYHGMSPIISALLDQKIITARSEQQLGCFKASVDFARTEGFIVAPETSHAVKVAIDEALKAKKEGLEKTIIFNCSGHGNLDLAAYDAYFGGKLQDHEYSKECVDESLKCLPDANLLCQGGLE